jgi:hypothetical protein
VAEGRALRIWNRAYKLDESDLLGRDLCVREDGDVIPVTLAELASYAEAVRQYPFRGDKGVGHAILMEPRYRSAIKFRQPAENLLSVIYEVYVQCLQVAFRPELRERINTSDPERLAIESFAAERAMPYDVQLLLAEYQHASPERKWEIFRLSRRDGWYPLFCDWTA